jgi:hydroxyproline O-arabinosyltransferase
MLTTSCLQRVTLDLKLPPLSKLMAQPPADHRIGNASLLHYTWGSIIKDTRDNDTQVWAFDKRFYTDRKFALKVRCICLFALHTF